jgi:hypothetical protein
LRGWRAGDCKSAKTKTTTKIIYISHKKSCKYLKSLGQPRRKSKKHPSPDLSRKWLILKGCYTRFSMYARKLRAEMVIGEERRPMPLDWLDSFCMRNFTGSQEFDDTLPTSEGMLEAGLSVQPERLAAAMSEWFTKRGKGNGQPVRIELHELKPR